MSFALSLISWARNLLVLLAASLPVIPPTHAAPVNEKFSICYVETSSALVPLAKLKGFFAAEGLDVQTRFTPTGVIGMNAMFKGECALSTAAEPPTVHFSLEREDFYIVASIAQLNNYVRILARADRGIVKPADLRGKRIATTRFTVGHAFLDTWLAAHGMLPRDVVQAFLSPTEIAQALRRGEVDAIALWEPHITLLRDELGAKTKQFDVPGLQVSPILLMARKDFVQNNPDAIARVLRALLRAEQFAKEQPAEARQRLAGELKLPLREIEVVWPTHDFSVRLGQSLIFILENAARWQIGLLPAEQRRPVPNYLDFMYYDGLKGVKPAAVTIIH